MSPFTPFSSLWTRRAWLTQNAIAASHAVVALTLTSRSRAAITRTAVDPTRAMRLARQTVRHDPATLQAMAQHAVDAAMAAGARYADVRLTRTVGHRYQFALGAAVFEADAEIVGVGVRALVRGYWGFAACPWQDVDSVTRVAQDAVAQATVNANGPPWTVELGTIPAARGTWATPVAIDPFQLPIEEKLDYLHMLMDLADKYNVIFPVPPGSVLEFHRREQTVATSEGALFTQTTFESAGSFVVASNKFKGTPQDFMKQMFNPPKISLVGLDPVGKGWEFLHDARLEEQFAGVHQRIADEVQLQRSMKPFTVGRYTIVCDGATMASLVDRTFGIATQLDRALGYEANAQGTSFLNDPLAMLGTLPVAASGVTVTANRSAPTQLATVKWDDEGVAPEPFTLVKQGVLTDFQTTREQAAWLAPYYQRVGQPIRSHGCAASADALGIPLQMTPNLALEPGPSAVQLADLVANVPKGILITNGWAQSDFQARNGLAGGTMREITNGRLGRLLGGGAVLYETLDLWKHVTAVGGPATEGGIAALTLGNGFDDPTYGIRGDAAQKGQPPQSTNYSVRAAAATIANQSVIDPMRKA